MPILTPDALFLDVDGVLIDSVGVKGDVFVEIFADIPDSADRVIAFHRANGGLTREIKIRQLLELLNGGPPKDSEVADRIDQFAKLVVERVIQAPEVPGTYDFLQEWSKRCPLFAVSATPENELRHILEARGMFPFLHGVRGWPPEKAELIIQEIAAKELTASQCLLVGDSTEDLKAAKRAAVRFLYFGEPKPGDRAGSIPRIAGWADFVDSLSEVQQQSDS